jgi:Zn finger protein HypA/HybF involved in hydrogenase expression
MDVKKIMDNREKNLTQQQVEYHASLIVKQVKKKRKCTKCGKSFISPSAANRRCDICERDFHYGELAQHIVII